MAGNGSGPGPGPGGLSRFNDQEHIETVDQPVAADIQTIVADSARGSSGVIGQHHGELRDIARLIRIQRIAGQIEDAFADAGRQRIIHVGDRERVRALEEHAGRRVEPHDFVGLVVAEQIIVDRHERHAVLGQHEVARNNRVSSMPIPLGSSSWIEKNVVFSPTVRILVAERILVAAAGIVVGRICHGRKGLTKSARSMRRDL